MDHNIPLQLRNFKLQLTILTNRCSHLPNSVILFYQSRINEIPLKINGVRIPPNNSTTVLLRFLRSAKAIGESEIVFVSMVHICVGNGLSIEVCIHGEKVIKEVFRQWVVSWGLKSETIKLILEMKVCVETDQRLLTREKVESEINILYPKLTSILEDSDENDDDDEEDVKASDEGIK